MIFGMLVVFMMFIEIVRRYGGGTTAALPPFKTDQKCLIFFWPIPISFLHGPHFIMEFWM